MDTMMHMDNGKKTTMGFLSFLPLVTFTIFSVYFAMICMPLFKSGLISDHEMLATVMNQHYTTLFILLAIAFITGAATLIYFMVHIARIRDMSAGTKLGWMLFMFLLGGIAFPIFWYAEIRDEPEYMPIYPDIA
jgi:hypothetical protein